MKYIVNAYLPIPKATFLVSFVWYFPSSLMKRSGRNWWGLSQN